MARLSNREEFTDDLGGSWVFETHLADGFVDFYVEAPGLSRRRLRRVPLTVHCPQRDADVALPLDIE